MIHKGNVDRGFYDKPIEVGTALMLCVSELGEALEADRKGRHSDVEKFKDSNNIEEFAAKFEEEIKDTYEDEIADTIIRLLDHCGNKGIDIEKHIDLKLQYNATREKMHGKRY